MSHLFPVLSNTLVELVRPIEPGQPRLAEIKILAVGEGYEVAFCSRPHVNAEFKPIFKMVNRFRMNHDADFLKSDLLELLRTAYRAFTVPPRVEGILGVGDLSEDIERDILNSAAQINAGQQASVGA